MIEHYNLRVGDTKKEKGVAGERRRRRRRRRRKSDERTRPKLAKRCS